MSQGRQTRDGVAVRRVQVMLDEITIERAKALGEGNLSIGLREMAKEADMNEHGKFESWEEMDDARERVEVSNLVSGSCVTVWEPGQSSHPAQYAGTISGTIEHVRLVNNQYELLAEGTLEQVTALIEAKAHRLVVRVEWRVKVGGQWEATVYRCQDLRPGDLGQGVEIPQAGFVVWRTNGELYASKHKHVFSSLEEAIALP